MKRLDREALDAWAELECEDVKVMDGLDSALVGLVQIFTNTPIAVYSYRRIIAELVRKGMTREEADEYFRFNIQGSYVGHGTPAIMYDNIDMDRGSI